MKFASRVRFLEIYSGVLTAAFSITVFGGFAEPRRAACDGGSNFFKASPNTAPDR